ncbi:hypothetical protein CAQUA_09625 [Corynebacterium aquatimens]|uniref:Uncharacterized protein n=1 Tax=Corynebacterium aquatimens TaxID=1190508 RepID=A0A931DWX4_9CORY|nr:hypothetical protein [Corynebacterium aquatimens]WJY66612.1 hypothetical protein CAQUA_09625 [Corynebacterium aquatimens]
MDFNEFAHAFRERTARRMLEFEAALKESQRQMEQTARSQAAARTMNVPKPPQHTPRGVYRGLNRGQVQSILRKEGPTATGAG